jgi:hypothetical protein
MAVTRGAPNEGGSKQTVASTPTTTNATPTSATSLFGSSPPKDVAAPSKNLKRKANDADLKVIDIDVMPDLTLVVGTPSHPRPEGLPRQQGLIQKREHRLDEDDERPLGRERAV